VKIFISYSRRDAGDFANQIHRHLSSFEHDIFTDINNIKAGEDWSNTIEENISSCDIFVTIVTHGSLHSPHVEREVLQAQKEKKTIIPCFHRSVTNRAIKWGLEKIQGVEFDDKFELARDLFLKIDIETINKPPEGTNNTKTGSKFPSHQPPANAPKPYLQPEEKPILPKELPLYDLDKRKEWDDKGYFLMEKKKYRDAIECFNKSLEIDKSNVFALYYKGYSLLQIGQYQNAVEFFTRATEIDPTNSVAWRNMGYAYKRIGMDYESKKSYDEAERLKKEKR
jgi:tetratricopeptide (TPR) repeat protein